MGSAVGLLSQLREDGRRSDLVGRSKFRYLDFWHGFSSEPHAAWDEKLNSAERLPKSDIFDATLFWRAVLAEAVRVRRFRT